MNPFVTRDDLTRIFDNAKCLAKLAETAQCISGDLSAGKRDTRDVREAIKRCHKRLGEKDLTKKQRAKLGRKLQFYDEWLHHTGTEIEKKNAAFSDAVIRIETEVRELAQVREGLAHVHRFEHRLSHDRPQARRRHKPVGRLSLSVQPLGPLSLCHFCRYAISFGVHIRALTALHPIKPTSHRCRSV